MARNLFAIERPRKISISIQGYDAQARTQAQQKKQLERSKRQKRKQKAEGASAKPSTAPQSPVASNPNAAPLPTAQVARADDDEIEALSNAASTSPMSRQVEQELEEAFGHFEQRRRPVCE